MASSAELLFIARMRDQASATIRSMGTNMGALGRSAGGVNMAMTELNQTVELVGRTFELARQSIGSTLDAFMRYDDAMTTVQRVTHMTNLEMDSFSTKFDTLAQKMDAVNVDRLMDISGQAAQLGLKGGDNILRFTETVSMLEQSVEDLGDKAPMLIVRVLNATGEGAAGIEKFGNVLAKLGEDAASGGERILDMTAMIAQATAQFNMGSDSMLGMATAASDLNFQPELFGTTTSRALTALYDATLNTTAGMKLLSDMTGISVEGFHDLIENDPSMALITFSEALDDVADSGRSVTDFLMLFGLNAEESRRILGTMAENTDAFRKQLTTARQAGQDMDALQKQYNITMQAYSTQVKEASNSWFLFRKQLGMALAPQALRFMEGLTAALDQGVAAMKNMDPAVTATMATIALSIPIFIAAAIAARGLWMALMFSGAGSVIKMLGGIIRLVGVLTLALGAATVGALRFAASLAFGAAISSIGLLARALFSLGGLLITLGAGGAVLSTLGSIIAGIGAALAFIVSLPAATIALIIAAIVALGAAIYGVIRNLDAIKAYMKKVWSDTGGNLYEALKTALWDAFEYGKEIFSGIGSYIWNKATGNDTAAAQGQPVGGGFGIDGPQAATDNSQKLGRVQLAQRLKTDLSKVTTLGTADQATIRTLDEYSKKMTEINKQMKALDELQKRAKSSPGDSFFQSMGVQPNEAQDYVDRLRGRLQVEKDLADTVGTRITELGEEELTVSAITGIEKSQVEINQVITEEFRKRGALLPGQRRDLEAAVVALQNMRKVAAIANIELDNEQELVGLRAVNAEERNRAEIIQLQMQLAREHVALTSDEAQRIIESTRALQQQRAANSYGELTNDLDRQFMVARAVTREEQNRVAVVSRLVEYQRENGVLGEEAYRSLERQMTALMEIEQLKSVIDQADPQGSALRRYNDDVATLQRAMAAGQITGAQYDMMLQNLSRNAQSTINPFAAQVNSLSDALTLMQVQGEYRDADRETLSTVIDLTRQGVTLTQEQVEAVRDMNRAMADLEMSQTSGLEGWASSISSARTAMLDIQKEGAEGLSSALVDSLYGEEDALKEWWNGLMKSMSKMYMDQAIAPLAEALGNDFGGLIPGLSTADAEKKAKDALSKADQLMEASLVTINAASVNFGNMPTGANFMQSAFNGAGGGAAGAVDTASMLEGLNETTNRSQINGFLKAGGVDLDAAITAWCAGFVNSALEQVGITGSGSNVATSFANWGTAVLPQNAARGDVLLQSRGNAPGETGGHVGFATGNSRQGTNGMQLEMLSGNSSDSVMRTWVDAAEVQIRRAGEAVAALGTGAGQLSMSTQGAAAGVQSTAQAATMAGTSGMVAAAGVQGLGQAAMGASGGATQAAQATSGLGQAATTAAGQIQAAAGMMGAAGAVPGGAPAGGAGGIFSGMGNALLGVGMSLITGLFGGGGGGSKPSEPKTQVFDIFEKEIAKIQDGKASGYTMLRPPKDMLGYARAGERGMSTPSGTDDALRTLTQQVNMLAARTSEPTRVEMTVSPTGEFDTRVEETANRVARNISRAAITVYDKKVMPTSAAKALGNMKVSR